MLPPAAPHPTPHTHHHASHPPVLPHRCCPHHQHQPHFWQVPRLSMKTAKSGNSPNESGSYHDSWQRRHLLAVHCLHSGSAQAAGGVVGGRMGEELSTGGWKGVRAKEGDMAAGRRRAAARSRQAFRAGMSSKQPPHACRSCLRPGSGPRCSGSTCHRCRIVRRGR